MHYSNLVAPLALLLPSLIDARIIGIAVPQTIKPGDGFNARILTEDYVQSVYDVAIAFGASSTDLGGSLGTVMGTYYLGPEQSNVLGNVTKWTVMPDSIPTGQATVTAALLSLYGAANGPTVDTFEVAVTIGDETSTTYVSSSGGVGN